MKRKKRGLVLPKLPASSFARNSVCRLSMSLRLFEDRSRGDESSGKLQRGCEYIYIK